MKYNRSIACMVLCLFLSQHSFLAAETNPYGTKAEYAPQKTIEDNGGFIEIIASEQKARIFVNGKDEGQGAVRIVPTGNELTIRTEHPDYDDTVNIINRAIPASKPNGLQVTAGVLGLLGTTVGTVLLVFANTATKKNPAPQAFQPVGTVSVCFGLPMYLASILIPRYDYPAQYRIDMAKAARYDQEGYHKITGFDRFGVNRAGVDKDGNAFSGKWTAGKKEGLGIFKTAKGDTYTGTFVEDALEGAVRWKSVDGVTCLGYWKNNAPEGPVAALLSDGGREVRYWKDGKPGESRRLSAKTISKLCDWIFFGQGALNGLAQGEGDAIDAISLNRIQGGRFADGVFVEGKLIASDGTVFSGRFADDKLVYGTRIGPQGNKFEGSFVNGEPEGNGSMTMPDGTKYSGSFKAGTYDGQGTITRPDGEKYEGSFKDGKPHGSGIYFNGTAVERCEYYEGRRIDQAYLIRIEKPKTVGSDEG